MTNFTYRCNDNYLKCKINTYGQAFSAAMQIVHHVPKIEGSIELKVSLSQHGDFNYRTIFKRTINFCKFFANKNKEIALHFFYREIIQNGTFPSQCPIEPVSKYDPLPSASFPFLFHMTF